MPVTDVFKRLVLGRALRSEQLGETELPKTIALPVFASDALSSVAYATQEIIVVLATAGVTYFYLTWYAAAAVVLVMATVIAAYRLNVHAYPSGGGDYEVANTNLGPQAGLIVASALLVDYVLTVAVSASAGVANLGATPLFSFVEGNETQTTLIVVLVIVLLNLRGLKESGVAFAVPTYAFMVGIMGMIGYGIYSIATGDQVVAESANYKIRAESSNLTALGIAYLGLRAFASGCTALTGVEAISNGVPAFRKPKSKNAASTLTMLAGLALTMFIGVTYLAIHAKVKVTEHNDQLIGFMGGTQDTVIAQVGAAVFGGKGNVPFYYVQLVTALILVLAANTAFNGFPVLASILAQDRYMPRQLHTRGDRLVYSNGIVILAAFACALIYAFHANPTKLIQLYIVGVFVSFTLSQTGMVRHWNRHIRESLDASERRSMKRKRVINFFAGITTGTVLVVVLVTKFVHGAWIAILAGVVFYFLMRGIKGHYDAVSLELVPTGEEAMLPARNHAIVLVSKIHKPTLRALAYARATRPSTLEALTVGVDEADSRRLQDEWDAAEIPVPLKVLQSPYREVTRPVIDYIKSVSGASPRDVVTVYIPEYVVGRWWEHLLHNQSALRLKSRLLFMPGVMVTSVPWQLVSSERRADEQD